MNDIIRQLQQRIDKKSNWIAENTAKYSKTYHIAWKEIVREHTLDKRLMGELIYKERYRHAVAEEFKIPLEDLR